MSLVDSPSTDLDIVYDIPNSPKYCNYHKFVLVEELLLTEDYRQLFHGKCRVIGKVLKTETKDFFLENVQITNLPEEYSLPEGTLKLYLSTTVTAHPTLENGKYVEVLGEVILVNPQEPKPRGAQQLTSKGIVEQMQFISTPTDEEKLLNYFKKNYKPALKVWYVSQINRAGDLISRNLEIRMMLEQPI